MTTNKYLSELLYTEFLLLVVFAWILVALWQRVIENFAYSYMGLHSSSALHAFLVAIIVTVILITYVYYFEPAINSITESQTSDINLASQTANEDTTFPIFTV